MTFQEIMDFSAVNRENFDCLKQQLQGNHILPVIGAGLSYPIYPLWSDLLKRIAADSSPKGKKQVYSMLSKAYLETHTSAFEDAAGLLLKDWGKKAFCKRLQNAFSPSDLYKPDNQELLQRMSVSVLPELFSNNMLLTTNYDHVIEECYRQKGLCLSHGDALDHEKITHWLRMSIGRPLLIKLHGDADKMETTAILDPQSYDAAYEENSDLVQTLRQSFQQKCILFLGCSLQRDRTMTILEDVSAPGISHFTVFASSPQRQKQQELIRRLGNRCIFPILYPDGKHDCVRVILEELLRQTAPDRYDQLPFKLCEAQFQAADSTCARFDPYAKAVALCGRHEELERLISFCTDSRSRRSWWMLTGSGGIGKTRLAVELQDKMRHRGWDVHFLNCDRLPPDGGGLVQEIGHGTLLIIDRILGRESLVGAWIENLFRHSTNSRLRVLIIDRDNVSQDHICHGAESPALLSEQSFSPFPLTLAPLAREELLTFIRFCNTPDGFSEKEVDDIYNQLASIDPELKRPLYAMFLAEVRKRSPNVRPKTEWELLQLILDIEFSRCRSYLKSQFYAPREVENRMAAYLRIKLAACLAGYLSSDRLADSFSEDWNLLTPKEFGTSLLHDLEGEEASVAPLLPDLLANFFVVQSWRQTPDSFQTLLSYNWELNCLNCARRLSYCALDFPDVMAQVRLLDLPLALESTSQKNAYAVLMINCSKGRDIETLKTVSGKLAMLCAESREPALVYPVAISATNLCINLDSFSEKIQCARLLEPLKNFLACEHYYAICLLSCMGCAADADSFRHADDLLWRFLSCLKTLNPLIPYELLTRYSSVRLRHHKEYGWPSLKQLLQRQNEVLKLVDSENPLCFPLTEIYFLILTELLRGSESQYKQYWTQLSNLYYKNLELYIKRDQIVPSISFCTVYDFQDKSRELIVRNAWENSMNWAEEVLTPASLIRYTEQIHQIFNLAVMIYIQKLPDYKKRTSFLDTLEYKYNKSASAKKEAHAHIYATALSAIYEIRLRPIFNGAVRASKQAQADFALWETRLRQLASDFPTPSIQQAFASVLADSTYLDTDINSLQQKWETVYSLYQDSTNLDCRSKLRKSCSIVLTNITRNAGEFAKYTQGYTRGLETAWHLFAPYYDFQEQLCHRAEQERRLTEDLLLELAKTLNNISAISGSLKKSQICSEKILKLLECNVERSQEVTDKIYLEYAKSLVHRANYIGPDMCQEQRECILVLVRLYMTKAEGKSAILSGFWQRIEKVLHYFALVFENTGSNSPYKSCIRAWNDHTPIMARADQMQLAKVILRQLSSSSVGSTGCD